MAFLLILIQVVFAAIFFFFGRMVETLIFLTGAVYFLMYFFVIFGREESSDVSKLLFFPNRSKLDIDIIGSLDELFARAPYYFASIFLYLGLLGLSYALAGNASGSTFLGIFSVIITSISLVLLGLIYVFWRKEQEFNLFRVYRIHTYTAMLFYVVIYIVLLFSPLPLTQSFLFGSLLTLLGLVVILEFDYHVDDGVRQNTIWSIAILGLLFIIVATRAYYYPQWMFSSLTLISLLALTLFFFTKSADEPRTKKSNETIKIARYIGTSGTLMAMIGYTLLIFHAPSPFALIVITLLILIGFHVFIHVRFQNYIHFILSFVSIAVLYLFSTKSLYIDGNMGTILLGALFLPVVLIIGTNLAVPRNSFDEYVIHYTGLTVMVGITLWAMFVTGLTLTEASILLIVESVVWYLSSTSLKKHAVDKGERLTA